MYPCLCLHDCVWCLFLFLFVDLCTACSPSLGQSMCLLLCVHVYVCVYIHMCIYVRMYACVSVFAPAPKARSALRSCKCGDCDFAGDKDSNGVAESVSPESRRGGNHFVLQPVQFHATPEGQASGNVFFLLPMHQVG